METILILVAALGVGAAGIAVAWWIRRCLANRLTGGADDAWWLTSDWWWFGEGGRDSSHPDTSHHGSTDSWSSRDDSAGGD